jgi:hypothetical protein
MTDAKPKRRWFQFRLRTLFVAVTLAAVISCVAPTVIRFLFPPKPENEFDKLIQLITDTLQTDNGQISDTKLSLTLGSGQEIHEQSKSEDADGRLGGGGF